MINRRKIISLLMTFSLFVSVCASASAEGEEADISALVSVTAAVSTIGENVDITVSDAEINSDEAAEATADIAEEIIVFEDTTKSSCDETEATEENSLVNDEAEEETLSSSADAFIYSDFTETQSTGTTEILSVEVIPVGENYSTVSFTFESDDGTKYEAVIAGIDSDRASEYESESGRELLKSIASEFLAEKDTEVSGYTYKISEDPASAEYTHDLIDAEKKASVNSDSLLCWAATASDMLWETGWAQELVFEDTGEQVFKSEDEVFDYFIKNFTDDAGTPANAIRWFFNGINKYQSTTNGRIVYGKSKNKTGGASQQLDGMTYGDGNGLYSEYAADTVFSEMEGGDIVSALEENADILKDGGAIGISIGNYTKTDDGDKRNSGHAVTIFGYIKQLGENIKDAIKGLFISDADNNKNEESSKEERVNSYTLYLTEKTELSNGVTGYILKGYGGNYVTDRVTILKASDDETIEKEPEDGGTKNAIKDMDFVFTSLELLDEEQNAVTEITSGDTVTISTKLKNMSYAYLTTSKYPVIYYEIDIYKSGEDTPCRTIEGSKDIKNIKALGTYSILGDEAIEFKDAGDYTVKIKVLGYSTIVNGERVMQKEAYISNNEYIGEASLKVVSKGGGYAEMVSGKSSEVYSASYVSGSAKPLEVEFECEDILSEEDFLKLTENGKEIDKDSYSVSIGENGKFEISFESEFLDLLSPGCHEFILSTSFGNISFEIEII